VLAFLKEQHGKSEKILAGRRASTKSRRYHYFSEDKSFDGLKKMIR